MSLVRRDQVLLAPLLQNGTLVLTGAPFDPFRLITGSAIAVVLSTRYTAPTDFTLAETGLGVVTLTWLNAATLPTGTKLQLGLAYDDYAGGSSGKTSLVDVNGLPLAFQPNAANSGTTTTPLRSLGTTNLVNLKATPGNIFELDFYNNAAYDVWFKLYNLAVVPTLAADVPRWPIQVPTKSGFSKSFINGRFFSVGISYAITKALANTDATAVVADDLVGTIEWL